MLPVVYFSTRYPAPLRKDILKDIRFSDSASAVVFSDAIFRGLAECGLDYININVPPIGHWPKMNRRFRNKTVICQELGRDVWNVGFVNMYIYQYFSIYWHTYITIKKVLKRKPAICLVYAINVHIIKAILQYRSRFAPLTKVVLIIPDFIEDMYDGSSLKSTVLRWLHGDPNKIYSQMDGFVYLTEQMREKTKSSKPYCVVEGIHDSSSELFIKPVLGTTEKTIFYSGKLEERFGVRRLVDAFGMIPDADARLVLCGSGDCLDYVLKKAAIDNRICYLGQIPRDDVLRHQSKAKLLVNPRTPEGEFTRYSFPSKNIQFLASGIPTLLYRLIGIPDEYYQYCFSIPGDELSVEVLSQRMNEAINLTEEESRRFGESARGFILSEKNAKKQCIKIIDLINQVRRF